MSETANALALWIDEKDKERSQWIGKPEEVLRQVALNRMEAYRIDALDAIHQLAIMPVDKNSFQNQIKLQAAKLLAGVNESPQKQPAGDGLDDTLRALNDAYHKDAPRIRSVRERVVTFEDEQPKAIEG